MRRRRQLVFWPLMAALLGVVAAALVVGATLLRLLVTPASDEPWGDLERLVWGLLLAVFVGVVVWVAGLARAARRLFAPGRRLAAGIWSTLAILATIVALTLVGTLVDSDRLGDWVGRALIGCGFALVLVVPSCIFLLWDRRPGTRPPQP